MEDVANCLAWFNAVINPFLYAFVGRNFRKNLTDIVRKGKKTINASVNGVTRETLM